MSSKRKKNKAFEEEFKFHLNGILIIFKSAGYELINPTYACLRKVYYELTKDSKILLLFANKKGVELYLLNWYMKNRTQLFKQYGINENDVPILYVPKKMQQVKSNVVKVKKSTTRWRDKFYTSKEWRQLRYKALTLHGRKCQCCNATAQSSGKPIHVDHIKPRSKFPKLELDINNLQILCEDCNLGKSNKDKTDWRSA